MRNARPARSSRWLRPILLPKVFPARALVAAASALVTIAAAAPTGAAPTASAAAPGSASRPAGPAPAGPVRFNRDVRPILSENCFFCHGPDKAKRKAGLRLDVREAAIEDKAIVPGRPGESSLWQRIVTKDADDLMPPPESHKTLSPAQVATLRRWIAEGAPYEAHWAYVPVARPPVPAVKDPAWARHPVDAFVRALLDGRGLSPSAPADRRTLLRRLSLDLVGLPPTPEELRAFENDAAPDAYERQVNRLLASPHFGERMAVPWLDVVRFADTVGYHGDQNVNVFPYRDYVIDAFNANKPFDQFTIEQIAGDLLPKPTRAQLVATGFNRLNMVTREGGAQPKEYLAKYAADRVRAVGTVWMGSTLGCAECHDHKYDPITARDFYSMAAFFSDVKQWGVYHDYAYTPNPDLRGFSNDHPFPPELEVTSPFLAARAVKVRSEADRLAAGIATRLFADRAERQRLAAWRAEMRRHLAAHPDGFRAVAPTKVEAGALESSVEGATVVVKGEKKDVPVALTVAPTGPVASLRLELVPHAAHAGRVLRHDQPAAIVRLAAALRRADGKETPIAFHFSDAREKRPQYANGHEVPDLSAGWRTSPEHGKALQTAVFELKEPLTLAAGEALVVTLKSDVLGAVRLATSPLATFVVAGAPSPVASLDKGGSAHAAFLRRALAGSGHDGRRALAGLYLASAAFASGDLARAQELHRERRLLRDGRANTVVTVAWDPRPTRLLPRGNWQDESGEVVPAAVPHFLPQPPNPDGRRLTRLDLARWLVSPDNPLTARTVVNRLWKQLFGSGLSAVVNDLGGQGEPPSHPELLDWLAAEFMSSGWDSKRLVKLLVTSRTYQQDSTARPKLLEADPGNRFYARQSQRRLDAEFVRDNALAVAGLLDRSLGGPSAFPYQPPGYFQNLEFPARDWVNARDERQYRRGLYTHWQRTFVHPMLANFDAPSREECTADRPPSNTPQQALTLLNDPTFVEAARVYAERLLSEEAPGADDADGARIGKAWERAVGRPARPTEVASLRTLLAAQRTHYRANPDQAKKLLAVGNRKGAPLDPVEHAAWTQVSRVVLNLYETITRL